MIPTNKTEYLASLLGLIGKSYHELTEDQEVIIMKSWNCLTKSGNIRALQHAHNEMLLCPAGEQRLIPLVQKWCDAGEEYKIELTGNVDELIVELLDILEGA